MRRSFVLVFNRCSINHKQIVLLCSLHLFNSIKEPLILRLPTNQRNSDFKLISQSEARRVGVGVNALLPASVCDFSGFWRWSNIWFLLFLSSLNLLEWERAVLQDESDWMLNLSNQFHYVEKLSCGCLMTILFQYLSIDSIYNELY